MHADEAGFLQKVLENPEDDTNRLVYADWLDERDDPENRAKADFLRLTARMLNTDRPRDDDTHLQTLAATLDPGWLAVVSRLKVEICNRKRAEEGRRAMRLWFDFLCDKRWDEMAVTEDGTVRFCEACKQNVHYCDTIVSARRHAEEGHCIAVDLGIIRREGDLSPDRATFTGRPCPEYLEEERLRTGVDEVSRERERRKQG